MTDPKVMKLLETAVRVQAELAQMEIEIDQLRTEDVKYLSIFSQLKSITHHARASIADQFKALGLEEFFDLDAATPEEVLEQRDGPPVD